MKVLALSGGVGGARLLDGLYELSPSMTAVVNTGDDFVHCGLSVCPDLDTVMYTLSGLADETRGWGLKDETFGALEQIRAFGGPDWFALGDRDLATHLLRTDAMRRGESLSAVTSRLCGALGITARIVPMSDEPCPTLVDTVGEGTLSFQHWLVRRRGEPEVQAIRFEHRPPPAPGLLRAIEGADVVIIGPSNPYVSIDPILRLEGVRQALQEKVVVAVSPIVGGRAIKGPLATMIPQLAGVPASADAIARHYGSLLSGMVVEHGDSVTGLPVLATETIMKSRNERVALAQRVLAFAAERLR
ncbi:MAG: 2-phospho-L-lactate transferase [Myxococcota bacterium]